MWQRRREYLPQLVEVEEAIRRAHDNTDGLVVVSDSADRKRFISYSPPLWMQ